MKITVKTILRTRLTLRPYFLTYINFLPLRDFNIIGCTIVDSDISSGPE